MKKNLVGLILASFFLLIPNVKAESTCSYSELAELNRIAGNVKASYETNTVLAGKEEDPDEPGVMLDEYEHVINVSILNITDDIYIKVTNDQNSNALTYYKKDTQDGTVTFKQSSVTKIYNYKIEVYSNKETCIGELLRTFNIQTPMYNDYSALQVCADNPEFYYCQEYITTENISYDNFYNKLDEYKEKNKKEKPKEKKKKTIGERIKEFYQDHKITINVIGSVIVASGVATTVILVKKRRGRVL